MMKDYSHTLVHRLAECIEACNHCMNACLMEDDVKMMTECIRLDRQCAETCSFALNMVQKDARFMREALMLCKNVCNACAQECRRYEGMDHCLECAIACEACAEECETYFKV